MHPPDTEPTTKFLLEEASRIYKAMSGVEISTYVTIADFQYYWQWANEHMSSSYSGLHMGRYKAARFDTHLSALHARKLSLAAKMGVSMVRWDIGVTVCPWGDATLVTVMVGLFTYRRR